MYFANQDFSPEAKLTGANADPEAQALIAERETLRNDKKDHQANKNPQGVIYWPSQKSIAGIDAQIAQINEVLKSKHGVYDIQNTATLSKWEVRTQFRGSFAVGIIFLLEFLFEGFMAFVSYYDCRYAIAMKYVHTTRTARTTPKSFNGKKLHALAG